jgi:molybdopterin synthase catalytic subunit
MVQLTNEIIDPTRVTQEVRLADCGAVATFLGTVRDRSDKGLTVALDYEAYPQMAEKKMAEIEEEVRARWPIGRIVIVHRVGHLEIGEVSVAIAVSSPHRDAAFAACRYAIDAVKERVPIWKKENWADGSSEWVHPGLAENAGA